MKTQLISVAGAVSLALAMAAPQASAQSASDISALRSQIEALQSKVEDLEKQQKAAQDSQDRTTDMIAQSRASSASSDWASKITWKGDLRYRYENVDPEEAINDQTRQRIRARFGLTAKMTDTVTGTIQLATNGGNGDPRSTNQTLGSDWDRKGVAIDLAYFDWKALPGLNVQLGKTPQPWTKVGSLFWDGDITPEGAAVKYVNGPFFANAFGYVLGERATTSDPTLLGGQFGATGNLGAAKLTGFVSYYDVGAVEGKVVTVGTGCTAAVNPVFFGNSAQGNTTVRVAGCDFLANDFNIIQAAGQVEFKAGSLPVTVFADFLQNQEADDLDTAYAGGFTLGKASAPQSWEFGYLYQMVEKDSQFGQFVDSDFGGGVTDTEGSVFKIGYAPSKGWVLNGTYFLNDRFVDAPGATEREYKRYQLDINFKF